MYYWYAPCIVWQIVAPGSNLSVCLVMKINNSVSSITDQIHPSPGDFVYHRWDLDNWPAPFCRHFNRYATQGLFLPLLIIVPIIIIIKLIIDLPDSYHLCVRCTINNLKISQTASYLVCFSNSLVIWSKYHISRCELFVFLLLWFNQYFPVNILFLKIPVTICAAWKWQKCLLQVYMCFLLLLASSTVKLTPDAFTESYLYTGIQETQVRVQQYKEYLSEERSINPGLKVRKLVTTYLIQLCKYLYNNT